jgi:hypothetical protein
LIAVNRAAQGRNTGQQHADNIAIDPENIFQPVISPEQSKRSFGFKNQQSFLSRALSQDKTSLNEAFQRIKISGNLNDMSHIEDLEESVGPLIRALVIREKYMAFSLQSYPSTVADFLTKTLEDEDQTRRVSFSVVRSRTGSDMEINPRENCASHCDQIPPKQFDESTCPRKIHQLLISYSIDETNLCI